MCHRARRDMGRARGIADRNTSLRWGLLWCMSAAPHPGRWRPKEQPKNEGRRHVTPSPRRPVLRRPRRLVRRCPGGAGGRDPARGQSRRCRETPTNRHTVLGVAAAHPNGQVRSSEIPGQESRGAGRVADFHGNLRGLRGAPGGGGAHGAEENAPMRDLTLGPTTAWIPWSGPGLLMELGKPRSEA